MRVRGTELWLSGTDLFPRIVPWVSFELSFGRLGWAKDPSVSKPLSKIGGADTWGHPLDILLLESGESSSPLLNESSGVRDLEWLIPGELAGVGKGILSDR